MVINTENNLGPAEVLELFGSDWEDLCARMSPVLIAWSADATDVHASGLYVLMHDARHRFYEVHGSTSSEVAFEGCWSPEPVSEDDMREILARGWLRDAPDNPLRSLRETAVVAMGLDLKSIDRRARDAQKLLNLDQDSGARRPGRRRR